MQDADIGMSTTCLFHFVVPIPKLRHNQTLNPKPQTLNPNNAEERVYEAPPTMQFKHTVDDIINRALP